MIIYFDLNITAGIELRDPLADTQADKRVAYVVCDKEKVVESSLIRLLRMRFCNKGLLNRHIAVHISPPDAITEIA